MHTTDSFDERIRRHAEEAAASLMEHGIFWIGLPRPTNHTLLRKIEALLPDRYIHMTQQEPWNEYAYLDFERLGTGAGWIRALSLERYRLMYEEGVERQDLPILP